MDQIAKMEVLSRSDQFAVNSSRWRLSSIDPAMEPGHFLQPVRARLSVETDDSARDDLCGDHAARMVAVSTRSALTAAALGFIIGGAVGNAIDRIVHGAVIDYLDLHALGRHFFVFNVADAAINVGVVLLIVDLLSSSRAPNTRNHRSPPHGAN